MNSLYLTSDSVGQWTGGGSVTRNEYDALQTLGPCRLIDRAELDFHAQTRRPARLAPFGDDDVALKVVQTLAPFDLVHVYAGTFTHTVAWLRHKGAKVAYTAAAHDIEVSRREHAFLGLPYNYPHLTDPRLWEDYVGGYREADLVVCPSKLSERCMRSYGCTNVEVIPHGCHLPVSVSDYQGRFKVGYLGAYGPDKGVRYLLEAWKRVCRPEWSLVLAGKESAGPWVDHLIERFGGGNIQRLGFVDDPADFYRNISVYCQSSQSEGWGLEVSEALSHGVPVICSEGAGAVDLLKADDGKERADLLCVATSVDEIVSAIEFAADFSKMYSEDEFRAARLRLRDYASEFTWDKVRLMYVESWKRLMGVK